MEVVSDISLKLGFIFFTQTGVGITGISKLLYCYSFALLTGENIRPADLIFNPLAFPNNLILLFRGISEICSAFQYKHFLNDVEYQVFFQVARSFLLVPHGIRVHSRPQIFDSDSIGVSSSERHAQDLLVSVASIFCIL